MKENRRSDVRAYLKDCLNSAKIDSKYHQKIEDYLNLLVKKNKELNLMSRKLTIEDIILEHVYDSLSPWELFLNYSEISDLGTGGGLPGVLLSIIFPDKKIILIDKSPLKIAFLNELKSKLRLNNVVIEERLVADGILQSDVITCRAFKSIGEILLYTKESFEKGTSYLLYKGRVEKIDEEIAEAKNSFSLSYEVLKTAPLINKERHMVLLKKI